MDSNALSNAKVYTDIQGLDQLRYDKNSKSVKKEVAQQFEAILVQMVLSSMREANQTFSSGLFGSEQMDMYEDMYDKQLSLAISKSGVGFADIVEKSMDQYQQVQPDTASKTPNYVPTNAEPVQPTASVLPPAPQPVEANTSFTTPEDFVTRLWSSAKQAAAELGVAPEVLLAQAALETDWGKKILPVGKGAEMSHNLFNIKTGSNWNGSTTTADVLEVKEGVLEKTKSTFRVYHSFMEGFMDYVRLIKQNPRYSDSMSKVGHPKEFVNALQQAGYATDQNYAEKVMKIFTSQPFQKIITKLKN
jgi:flagellar protein FlgJ